MLNLTVAQRNFANAPRNMTPKVAILLTALLRITEIPGLFRGTRSAHSVSFFRVYPLSRLCKWRGNTSSWPRTTSVTTTSTSLLPYQLTTRCSVIRATHGVLKLKCNYRHPSRFSILVECDTTAESPQPTGKEWVTESDNVTLWPYYFYCCYYCHYYY